MSSTRTTFRNAAAVAAAVLAATGLGACTESAEDVAATSTTTATIPDEIPTVAWLWSNSEEATGADVVVPLYASIQGGTVEDRLIGITVDPELAESARIAGADSVELPPATTVNLAEDGTHLELVGLKEELKLNRAFTVTLVFETAGEIEVQGAVRNPVDPHATS